MLASVAMDKIYSESFWNLFDDLDSSLNPPGQTSSTTSPIPTFTLGSAFSMLAAGTHVT